MIKTLSIAAALLLLSASGLGFADEGQRDTQHQATGAIRDALMSGRASESSRADGQTSSRNTGSQSSRSGGRTERTTRTGEHNR